MLFAMAASVPAERFALLFELSRAFGARLELDALLRLVLERTTEALAAEACSVLLLDRAADELYFLATSDPALREREPLDALRFPADRGVAGGVLRDGRARLVADVAAEASFFPSIDEQTGVRTRSLLCAPLRGPDGAIGVIEVVNRRGGGAFTEDDLAFLDALSGSLAVALENARLYAAVRSNEARLEREVSALRRERRQRERFAELVGGGPAMERVFALMETAAESAITVLIQGETGVGKELVARAIHRHGPRARAPVHRRPLRSAARDAPRERALRLRRGAFTGASEDRAGLFEAAHGGTLFLDEIGETPPATQVKLLRALQEGEIRRVGDTRTRTVDVRVISATHRSLTAQGEGPRFRQDLYYRLAVFPIVVPPLRERREDVPAAREPAPRAHAPPAREGGGGHRAGRARAAGGVRLARERARARERDRARRGAGPEGRRDHPRPPLGARRAAGRPRARRRRAERAAPGRAGGLRAGLRRRGARAPRRERHPGGAKPRHQPADDAAQDPRVRAAGELTPPRRQRTTR